MAIPDPIPLHANTSLSVTQTGLEAGVEGISDEYRQQRIEQLYSEILALNGNIDDGRRKRRHADLYVRTSRAKNPWNTFVGLHHSDLDPQQQVIGANTPILSEQYKELGVEERATLVTPRTLNSEKKTGRDQIRKAVHEILRNVSCRVRHIKA